MRFATLMVVACLGCPGKSADEPKRIDDTPLRIRIAQAEARRGAGLDELISLAKQDKPPRLLALRGLGRIGGSKAITELGAALGDADPDVVGEAATALGLAMSLDDELAGNAAITKQLVDALPRARQREVDVIEGIGRAAGASAQLVLVTGLAGKPEVAAASAIALGRYGRRKVELSEAARAALIAATKHVDARVRYGAAHALAREHLVKPEETVASPYARDSGVALAVLLKDSDALVRAQAAQALVRRKAVIGHRTALANVLFDPDWRVAVEAIRGLAGDASDETGRRQAAVALMFWWHALERPTDADPSTWFKDVVKAAGTNRVVLATSVTAISDLDRSRRPLGGPWAAHVIVEGLRAIAAHAKDETIQTLIVAVGERANLSVLPEPTPSWIRCLSIVVTMRTVEHPDYTDLTNGSKCRLPDHLRLPLAGELVAAKVGTVDQRRTALRPLLEHADARVRVSGMTALASMWDDGNEADHRAAVAMTIAALGSKDGLIAGTAAENAATLYKGIDKANATDLRDALDAAIIARAQTEQDPELAAALFGTITERKMAAGAAACRAGLRGSPVLVKAAVDCMKALGQPVEPPPIGPATAPPVDVAMVIGQSMRWKLVTTRGEIEIELRPDIAPWAVATVVTLTRKGYYDGLEMHRVVPNFVAQGGDPTQSGWGGPGFAIPAEPSSGAGYVEGGVGMADAGRDSAGSQWFIMHAPAPHLDGRYTWIGRVVSGQRAADSLLIGDKVVRATIVHTGRP